MAQRKGQMFVIGAIVIITGIVMLKGLFSFMPTMTASSTGFTLENAANEYERVAAMDYMLNTSTTDSFSIYLRERVSGFGALYLYTRRANDAHAINVGNFLGYNITVSVGGDVMAVADGYVVSMNHVGGSLIFNYEDESVQLSLDSKALLYYEINLQNGYERATAKRTYRIV